MTSHCILNHLSRYRLMEVLFYVIGMIFLICGIGSLIVSIDPNPLPTSYWKGFFIVGLILVSLALPFLATVVMFKKFPSACDETACSVADLLSDTFYSETSTASSKNGIGTLESVTTVQQSTPVNNSILFYKETFV